MRQAFTRHGIEEAHLPLFGAGPELLAALGGVEAPFLVHFLGGVGPGEYLDADVGGFRKARSAALAAGAVPVHRGDIRDFDARSRIDGTFQEGRPGIRPIEAASLFQPGQSQGRPVAADSVRVDVVGEVFA